ncbi:MAG TPA: hypothetical protein VMP01_14405 [Pirellulaceae bacterium]|nr:hypothetical protein [Pirellulaceae bacterium]
MDATTPAGPPIPVHELLDQLPPPDEIRALMDELDAQRDALMPLLRASIRAKKCRRKPPTTAPRQEASSP